MRLSGPDSRSTCLGGFATDSSSPPPPPSHQRRWGLGSLFHSLFSTTAPDYDRSQWLDEKFKLGLDFPNVGTGVRVMWGQVRRWRSPPSAFSAQRFQNLLPSSQALSFPVLRHALGTSPVNQSFADLVPTMSQALRVRLFKGVGAGGPWPTHLPLLPLQLPYLIDGAHNIILCYIARKHNLCKWGWGQDVGKRWPCPWACLG